MAQPAPRPLPVPSPASPSPDTSTDEAGDVLAAPPDPETDTQTGLRRAVGYVCIPGDEDRINGLHHRLAVQARQAGLDLVEVYADRQTPDDATVRPGLTLAVDEIARHPDAVLLVPDLSHLPATREGWAAWEERFTSVVTEIHTLSPTPSHMDTAEPERLPGSVRADDKAPRAEVGRARLTPESPFEVTVQPDDEVAGVIALLRQLPAAARFVESYGDVDTTLAFLSTATSGPMDGPVSHGQAKATGRLGQELVGFTTDDLDG
ncbi:hypothetical protein I6A60_06775 [Frankia sp. AgB1.9]|uniref:hypothetical protein n=1 Tax=unclassified Frankia TaxID=2632575 RepID=UPI00193400C0|nr:MULTISPECIES: hypothetical protein [unclassified Frankia]MBL7492501.1 hypothetical protein [Frankia sp. AgW1.1]MBL7547576.1 hypothetical protein [Frankia sp. AgB1.9]MBL7619497.1 hypothetical protein [Frankia sp. AgB1.8]